MKRKSIQEKGKLDRELRGCVRPNPRKKPLLFGDLITAVYDAYGKQRARGILRLALRARRIAFEGRYQYLIA